MKESILSQGISLYNQKAFTGALSFFLSLPSDCGADKNEVAYYLGLCYTKLERYDDALLYLEQVVTSGTHLERTLQCRFLLAVIYALSGRRRLADFELNKLLETGFMSPSVYAAIAYIAWEQDDTQKCLAYYEKSLEDNPSNITSLNGLGYVLACKEKDLTRALSLCKQAVNKAPDSAACLDSLGWVYYKLGLFDDSRKYLEQAHALDKENGIIREHIQMLNEAGR